MRKENAVGDAGQPWVRPLLHGTIDEVPSSLRTSVLRERTEKGRARCGDKRQMCDRIIVLSAWLNAELQSNHATAALLFVCDSSAAFRPTAYCVGPSTLARLVAPTRTRAASATLRKVAAQPSVTVCSTSALSVASQRFHWMKWFRKFVSSLPRSGCPCHAQVSGRPSRNVFRFSPDNHSEVVCDFAWSEGP